MQFLDLLIANIRARFPHVDLLSAMEIFEPQSYPADQRLLVGSGNGNLEILLGHYGSPLETKLTSDLIVWLVRMPAGESFYLLSA